jgi:hypothetical protein
MLQIDHVYEFFYKTIFKDNFSVISLPGGVTKSGNITGIDVHVFTPRNDVEENIFFYDQEPLIPVISTPYIDLFTAGNGRILVTSEHSSFVNLLKFKKIYYFFHGFAALDWYRGYHALNFSESVIKSYNKDFISYNRIIGNDRSYRIYFISKLAEAGLLPQGIVSFNVADDMKVSWQDEVNDINTKLSTNAKKHINNHLINIDRLIVDSDKIHGSASADILRNIDRWIAPDSVNPPPEVSGFWHVVTETVFYYDKLHLTEKIFKPIVMKQPFMLLAAPGNLAYLKSYGFKTFEGIIDESYDLIQDPDARIDAVVKQLVWYCTLSAEEKQQVIEAIAPIVEYNFQHFYTTFKHIISRELITNCQELFETIGYNDSDINYEDVFKTLIN